MLLAVSRMARTPLRACISQSELRIQRRLKEKRLQEELKEIAEKGQSQTDKRLEELHRKLETKKLPEYTPERGYRLNATEEEMAKANPDVRTALSLDNGSITEWMQARRRKLAAEIGNNEHDTGNSGVQVAFMTEKIISLGIHLKLYRNDSGAFLRLQHLRDKRRKMLTYLHRTNYYLYKVVTAKYEIPETTPDHHFTRMRRRSIRLG